VGSGRERLRWWIAFQIDRLFNRRQCWADLVSWVLNDEPIRDIGLRGALPWRPIGESCHRERRGGPWLTSS
jgi:hypothetical protein